MFRQIKFLGRGQSTIFNKAQVNKLSEFAGAKDGYPRFFMQGVGHRSLPQGLAHFLVMIQKVANVGNGQSDLVRKTVGS